MKKLIELIFKIFCKKKAPDKTNLVDKKPKSKAKPNKKQSYRVAFVLGHTLESQGAKLNIPDSKVTNDNVQYHGQHEYAFNSIIFKFLKQYYFIENKNVKFFYRNNGTKNAYKNAARWGADFCVELHFNANEDKKASGCYSEILSEDLRNPEIDADLFNKAIRKAKVFAKNMKKQFNIRKRCDGVHATTKDDRAHYLLSRMDESKMVGIVLEPFFGSNEQDVEKIINKGSLLEYVEQIAKLINNLTK